MPSWRVIVRIFTFLILISAGLLIGLTGARMGFALLNSPSDLAVAGGVVLLGLTVGAVMAFGGSAFKRLAPVALLAVAALATSGCTRIEPGHVGIKISMAGSDRGVSDIPTQTGWVFYNPGTTRVYEYPTYVQTAVWTRDKAEGRDANEELSFSTKDGLSVTADVSLSYQLEAVKVPSFYVKFRNDDLDTFTHGFLRNVARDAFNEEASHYSAAEIYGPAKDTFLTAVRKRLQGQVADIGVSVQQFGFIGAPRLPQQIVEAYNASITANQKATQAQNELQVSQAEAAKKVAAAEGEAASQIARAKGEAESNRLRAQSITPEILRMRELEIQQASIEKWNGTVPGIVTGGGAGFLYNLPSPPPQKN